MKMSAFEKRKRRKQIGNEVAVKNRIKNSCKRANYKIVHAKCQNRFFLSQMRKRKKIVTENRSKKGEGHFSGNRNKYKTCAVVRSHRDKKLRSQNRLGEEATERSHTKSGKRIS